MHSCAGSSARSFSSAEVENRWRDGEVPVKAESLAVVGFTGAGMTCGLCEEDMEYLIMDVLLNDLLISTSCRA